MTRSASYPAAAALAMARAQKRIADKYQDQSLASHAETLESRARDAVGQELADMPPVDRDRWE